MSEIKVKEPWPKIQFKTDSGHIYDGYLYYILGDCFYISQNDKHETMGLAQNWIISHYNIIKFYDEKYGLKCTCGATEIGHLVHFCNCQCKTINLVLF